MEREALSRLSIEIPDELHRRVKVRAAEEGRKIRELVVEVLEKALSEKKPRKGGRDGR